ncbi:MULTISPECIES: penicillin acylase family protein [Burkholderiaceae]|nr:MULTISPECIES: penicillin acylase family protein [Burkholderiaceae]
MNTDPKSASAQKNFILPGLETSAEVWRDKWGIPHIRATSDWDAFVALGYVHATDRLWQMESNVRKGTGRWSEWAGEDGLATDRLARSMNLELAAKRDFDALDRDAKDMLEAYSVGVNAFIAAGELPVEYGLLGTTPEPWKPWHCIAVMRQLGFMLGGNWMKLIRAAAIPAIGADGASKLRYDDGGNERNILPWDSYSERWKMDIERLKPAITELLHFADGTQTGGGSNNWAVGKELTETGRPLLMGDPHRDLELPSFYAQVHVAGATFDAIGIMLPGVPGMSHIGHNHKVAWGVTTAFVDVNDFYIENFKDDGKLCRTESGWAETAKREEVIRVRGAKDVVLEVFETPKGPVIVGDPKLGKGISLRSGQIREPDLSLNCMLKMLRAESVDGLHEAIREWSVSDHNLVAADIGGNIGHRVRSIVPDRSRENGWLPVPAWLPEFDWKGTVPFDKMPHAINPPSHKIVTANNRVTTDSAWPYLSTDCHPPYRAERIVAEIEKVEKPTIDKLLHVFADRLSIPALLFIEHLKHLPQEGLSASAQERVAAITAWDGRMEKDSTAATIYTSVRLNATWRLAELSKVLTSAGGVWKDAVGEQNMVTQLWWVVPTLMRDNDTSLLNGQSWNDVLKYALEAPTAKAVGNEQQPWHHAHTPAPTHPLAKQFPTSAATLNVPCAPIGGDGDTVFATGYPAGTSTQSNYGSLCRYAFDVGQWQNSKWIVYLGASGIIGDKHRTDQNQMWANAEMIPMMSDWAALESSEDAILTSLYPK